VSHHVAAVRDESCWHRWRRQPALAVLASFAGAVFLLACSSGASARTHGTHHRGRPSHALRLDRGALAAVPAHVPTWAYDDGCNGGSGASGGLVRRWVSFAETNCGTRAAKARSDCHAGGRMRCQVIQYLDTGWYFPVQMAPLAGAAATSWWLHAPAPDQGARIYTGTFGGGFLLNQRNPGVQAFFRAYVRKHFSRDDGLLMDWQTPSLAQELYYSTCGCNRTAEVATSRGLQTAHEAMSAALTRRNGSPYLQIDNSLAPNPFLSQGLGMLDRAGVEGFNAEGEPEEYGVLDSYYSTLLDQIAYVADRTHGFVVLLSRGTAGASYEDQSRRVAEATMLIGFSAGHLVDWADLEEGARDLAVWPEEGIYPTQPLESMAGPGGRGCLAGNGRVCTRGGHNDVEVAPGVYRREFGACFDAETPIGPCAAIVNTTDNAATVQSTWLHQSYSHEITFGGDVQSGGTIDVTGGNFAAGSTPVASHDALLLAR
jgi:hypothetical protein